MMIFQEEISSQTSNRMAGKQVGTVNQPWPYPITTYVYYWGDHYVSGAVEGDEGIMMSRQAQFLCL